MPDKRKRTTVSFQLATDNTEDAAIDSYIKEMVLERRKSAAFREAMKLYIMAEEQNKLGAFWKVLHDRAQVVPKTSTRFTSDNERVNDGAANYTKLKQALDKLGD